MTKRAESDAISNLQDAVKGIEKLIAEADLTNHKRQTLRKKLVETTLELNAFSKSLDPISAPQSLFDPSDPKVIGRFVSLALVAQDKISLAAVDKVYGSGVYAIYYSGNFEPYKPISSSETPIYVGQASSKDKGAKTPQEQGPKLSNRLVEHQKNIIKAISTLDVNDFRFRSLVVQTGWETAAEDYLIHLFRPIWNNETKILYGLGKHGDSSTTRANKRSPWDTIHPGRKWAESSNEDAKSEDLILSQLEEHFKDNVPFQSVDVVLANFLAELRQI